MHFGGSPPGPLLSPGQLALEAPKAPKQPPQSPFLLPFWDVPVKHACCMWLGYCTRHEDLTSEGCPLVSLQHVLLPGPPPGYIEGQIASMATRTGQQNEVAACLNQAAMRRWPSTRVCGTLAGNTAVYAQPGAYRGCPPRNPWAKRPSGRPGRGGSSSTQKRSIASSASALHL